MGLFHIYDIDNPLGFQATEWPGTLNGT